MVRDAVVGRRNRAAHQVAVVAVVENAHVGVVGMLHRSHGKVPVVELPVHFQHDVYAEGFGKFAQFAQRVAHVAHHVFTRRRRAAVRTLFGHVIAKDPNLARVDVRR